MLVLHVGLQCDCVSATDTNNESRTNGQQSYNSVVRGFSVKFILVMDASSFSVLHGVLHMRIFSAAVAGVLLSLDALAVVGAPASTLSVTNSAVLLQPNSNAYEGVLLQSCVGGVATIRVALATPMLIQQQNAL